MNESKIITAHVRPRSSKNALEWIDEETVKVFVTNPAEKGKANEGVINLLSEYYNIPKTCVEIARGKNTRIKQIRINKKIA